MRNNNVNIKSFSIDYNWIGKNFAPKSAFNKANALDFVKWNKEFGCNNFWTFGVSYNGRAWYDSKFAPKVEGLESDFLNDTVNIGHEEGMEVFAYMCLAANPVVAEKYPEWIREKNQDLFYMILCDDYLDYFCSVVKEILTVSNVDGLVFDWFRGASKTRKIWKEAEIKQYNKLMDTKFPINGMPEQNFIDTYEFRAIENAWKKIKNAIVKTRDVKIWTNHPFEKINDPVWNGNMLLKEVDYVLNESPNLELLTWLKNQVGKETVIVQNLCGWLEHDLDDMPKSSIYQGMFGFAQADPDSCLPYTNDVSKLEQELNQLTLSDERKLELIRQINVANINYKNMQKMRKMYKQN